jgi:hypothetical protein
LSGDNEQDFSEEEQEKLRELTLKHRRGEIEDVDFELESKDILGGREFPILTSAPQHPSEALMQHIDDDLSFDIPDLKDLTTCGKRSVRQRRTLIRKQRAQKKESYVAKAIAEEDAKYKGVEEPPRQVTSDSLIIEDNLSVTSLSALQESEALFKSKGSVFLNFTLGIFGILGVCSLTLLIAFSQPVERFILNLSGGNSLSASWASIDNSPKNTLIRPLFGPIAVENCTNSCETRGGNHLSYCLKACKDLSLGSFARRITIGAESPAEFAEQVAQRCLMETVERKSSEPEAWKDEFTSANSLINHPPLETDKRNFANVRLLYENLLESHSKLTIPQNANFQEIDATQTMSRTLCIKTNQTLAKLGGIITANQSDSYSMGFYSRVEKHLLSKLNQEKLALEERLDKIK